MKKKILVVCSVLIIFSLLFIIGFNNNNNTKIPILMYHHLVTKEDIEKNPALGENGSIISVEKFEEQMNFLQEKGYNAITLQDLANHIKYNTPLPDKPVVITFDDGYESNYKLAYPILKKNKLHATINIVVRATTKPSPKQIPHLTWGQMKEMQDSKFISIQSHTYDMHEYALIDGNEKREPATVSPVWLEEENRQENNQEYIERIRADLKLAKETIENHLDTEVNVFCFPYGAYNDTLIKTAKNLGHEIFITVKKGYNTKDSDLHKLKRFAISEQTTLKEFKKIVSGKTKITSLIKKFCTYF